MEGISLGGVPHSTGNLSSWWYRYASWWSGVKSFDCGPGMLPGLPCFHSSPTPHYNQLSKLGWSTQQCSIQGSALQGDVSTQLVAFNYSKRRYTIQKCINMPQQEQNSDKLLNTECTEIQSKHIFHNSQICIPWLQSRQTAGHSSKTRSKTSPHGRNPLQRRVA